MLQLAFGSGVQRAVLPQDWQVSTLGSAPFHAGASERSIIEQALSSPVAGPALTDFVSPTNSILILVSDKTRRCRSELFLPVLLERLADAGIPDEHIALLFATGTHPTQSEEERRSLVGDAVYDRYRVYEHDARDPGYCVLVGTTEAGTEIRINRLVAAADRVIATGTIVHHYFAGFGGGAKLFVPGVCAYETAVANHRRTITSDGRFHPGCGDGITEGNPVISDIVDALRFMPPTWYFAALLDEHGRIADALCGDLLPTHEEGCRRVDARFRVEVDEPYDLVIVSTGGYPKDINFIQSHKSLHHAAYVTREGGSILLVAECREAMGNDALLPWFDIQDDDEFRRALLERYRMNAHTALTMREKARRFHIHAVTAMDSALVQRLGMRGHETLQAAVDKLDRDLAGGARVLVIENGSLYVPRLANPDA